MFTLLSGIVESRAVEQIFPFSAIPRRFSRKSTNCSKIVAVCTIEAIHALAFFFSEMNWIKQTRQSHTVVLDWNAGGHSRSVLKGRLRWHSSERRPGLAINRIAFRYNLLRNVHDILKFTEIYGKRKLQKDRNNHVGIATVNALSLENTKY